MSPSIAADERFERAVLALIDELASLSPASLRLAKRALRLARPQVDFERVDAADRLYVEALMNTPDAIEGLRAFMEKRPPEWQ